MEAELQNPLLYTKLKYYENFVHLCHVGDTYVWETTKSVITYIKQDTVISRVVNQDGSKGREMGVIITLGFSYGIPIYKYVGPTAENAKKKQELIDELATFLFEARVRPFEEGPISFVGEDYRSGREEFKGFYVR
jgi:hypothetical protein